MPHFVKSHGLGNDYIVIDPRAIPFELTPETIRLICHRNLGVGSDGILAVAPGGGGDFGVRIFNPDGSEAEKSGNGVRIFAKFLRDHGYTDQGRFVLHTLGGLVPVELELQAGRVAMVTANMGTATFDPLESIEVEGERFAVTSLSVGNPHCVIVVPDVEQVDLRRLGPKIEHHPAFPNRTNVQFAQVVSRSEVRIVIWERGAGETLASGSSSCAVAAACQRLGLVDSEVTISMPGGQLHIALAAQGDLWMRGPVEEVCHGDFSPDLLRRVAGRE
ncbi:MAG: diaminopimelate epimerase [Chloroflexi bacterium]|nr:diaminopimelate epimerase [Chloroflexota bacterium]